MELGTLSAKCALYLASALSAVGNHHSATFGSSFSRLRGDTGARE
jgi:hypothetical protein